MPVLNIALVSSEDFAKSLGKKGDVRDVESYVHKEVVDDDIRVLSFIRPLRHPEKLRPLLSVLNVAKVGIVEISKIDACLGEILVAFSTAQINQGHAIISPNEGEWIDANQVKLILSQAGLEGWKIHESIPDTHDLRTSLFTLMDTFSSEREMTEKASLVIPIDQHFNVKGVGLVAIGYVQSGTISKHDEIVVQPAGEKGITRSLQVMDDDVETSRTGDRVGVAIRNLREGALHRGCVLTHSETEALTQHKISEFSLAIAPFQKRELNEGDVIHGAIDLQFVVGRITSIENNKIVVEWEQPLCIRNENPDALIIAQLDAGNMRIMGIAENLRTM